MVDEPVTCLLYKKLFITHQLEAGHPFYKAICTADTLVYGNAPIPPHNAQRYNNAIAQCRTAFVTGYQKANIFYQNAGYSREKDTGLACFMLHQCAEKCLRTIATCLYNRDKKTHHLHSLMSLVAVVAPEAVMILQELQQNKPPLFNILESACLNGRYDPDFSITGPELDALYNCTGELLVATEAVFKRWIPLL